MSRESTQAKPTAYVCRVNSDATQTIYGKLTVVIHKYILSLTISEPMQSASFRVCNVFYCMREFEICAYRRDSGAGWLGSGSGKLGGSERRSECVVSGIVFSGSRHGAMDLEVGSFFSVLFWRGNGRWGWRERRKMGAISSMFIDFRDGNKKQGACCYTLSH